MFARLSSLARVFGPGWLLFRLSYALRKRTGLLRWKMPDYHWDEIPLSERLRPGIPAGEQDYARWRSANCPAYLFDHLPVPPAGVSWETSKALVADAEAFLHGRLRYFSAEQIDIGMPPDWGRDPSSGARLPLNRFWAYIPDEGDYDIKYVWEPARFQWAYTLARAYALTRNERFALGFWTALEDWMENNPPNRGPGWMDGQECALRLGAACFGLAAFRASPTTTPRRLARFTLFAAALAERIRANLSFALSTRSNHTISEAFGLWLAGSQFPELKAAAAWRDLGRRILIQEAERQLFADGGYAMYSLHYQRFILHLYCLALRLGELNADPFPREIYDKIGAAADFLFQLSAPESGALPEFGSNDGSLVLPLNSCAYNDFRPLLQLCHYTAHRSRLFAPGPWDEDLFWLYGPAALELPAAPPPAQETRAFLDAGVYTLRTQHTCAVLRCVNFRSRPSHADQLHCDLWLRGENIAIDPGSYSYHAAPPWRNGLAGAAAHNTVTVDESEPMTRLSRFTWGDWAQGRVIQRGPGQWIAEQDGYRSLPDPVSQRRAVLVLPQERWLVLDSLRGRRLHRYQLHWLLADLPFTQPEGAAALLLQTRSGPLLVNMGAFEGAARFSLVRADPQSIRGWRSPTYGRREPAISTLLERKAPSAAFWTLFGRPGDRVEVNGSRLTVTASEHKISIDTSEFFD